MVYPIICRVSVSTILLVVQDFATIHRMIKIFTLGNGNETWQDMDMSNTTMDFCHFRLIWQFLHAKSWLPIFGNVPNFSVSKLYYESDHLVRKYLGQNMERVKYLRRQCLDALGLRVGEKVKFEEPRVIQQLDKSATRSCIFLLT